MKKLARLSAGQSFKLAEFVRDEFTKSNLSEPDFAKHAEAVLGFRVSSSSVTTARGVFGIAPNRMQSVNIHAVIARIELYEKRVGVLEAQVATLLRERTERAYATRNPAWRDKGGDVPQV